MRTVIHVNQHVIRKNIKQKAHEPVLSVKQGDRNEYAHRADILDDQGKIIATVVYSPDKPLNCGARCWIETDQPVTLHTEPACGASAM